VTRSSFPKLVTTACAGALLVMAPERVAAQGGATALRVGIESAFEGVSDATASTSTGVSRFHVDLSTARASRRSSVTLWSGITAQQPWLGASQTSLAGAFSVDGRVTLSRRNSLRFSERVASAPTDVFAFVGAGTPAALSRSVVNGSELPDANRTTSSTGLIALTRVLDARSQASFTATQSVARTGRDHVASTGVSAGVLRRFGEYVGWHLGYGFVQSTTTTDGAMLDGQEHDIDAGFDYARPLSFWRHTRLSVTTGTSLLTGADGSHGRLNVSAELSHQLSARWSAAANYSRPIAYVPGFAHPLVSDALRVGFTGTLPHRLLVEASAGAAVGAEEAVGGAPFTSYTGAVRLSRRLSSVWAVEAEYHDARFRFAGDQPTGGIPAAFARRGFRAGLVWVPGGRLGTGAASAR
jgi:hypothetical protein